MVVVPERVTTPALARMVVPFRVMVALEKMRSEVAVKVAERSTVPFTVVARFTPVLVARLKPFKATPIGKATA